jgi:aminoglycoside phosphotransferase (APT) family kinase protein
MSSSDVRTPAPIIGSVVRSVCGRHTERIVRLTGGGMSETYRAELAHAEPVVVRIARRSVPWFDDEARVMNQARAAGVPTADVLGVEHLDHDGELLSFSVQSLLPGRPLDVLVDELPFPDVEGLVMDSGELLARAHSIVLDRGPSLQLRSPDQDVMARAVRAGEQTLGAPGAALVERGADLVREELAARPAPDSALAHGDWLPKHLMVAGGKIVGVVDWELAGSAPRALDLAGWEVCARHPLHDRSDLLARGYARIADPEEAAAGWVPAYAVGRALEILGWRDPASSELLRRCFDVVRRHTGQN